MPDDTVEISIDGVDELLNRFQAADPVATQLLTDAMGNSLDYIAQDAEVYPPESDANAPPPPYYIRGTGTQYANGTNRQESLQLNEHWEKEITLENDGIVGTAFVGDSIVPYAKYVHSPNFQRGFHGARGWRTTVKIAEDVTDKVRENFSLATAQLVAFLNGG
jgi:hypothetical protein